LKKFVGEGKFREDLYYRINTVEIEIPPLRERKEDLQNLSEFFIQKYQKKYAREDLEFENDEELTNYHFPGNIRELEHTIERAIILSEDGKINLALQNNPISASENLTSLNLEEMEEKMIANALKKYKGNISLASEALGLTRASLYRRMEKFGL
jgi:transcriptional regulator with PAS, ATPase and Fis domain